MIAKDLTEILELNGPEWGPGIHVQTFLVKLFLDGYFFHFSNFIVVSFALNYINCQLV